MVQKFCTILYTVPTNILHRKKKTFQEFSIKRKITHKDVRMTKSFWIAAFVSYGCNGLSIRD